jgi:hypothetical protein
MILHNMYSIHLTYQILGPPSRGTSWRIQDPKKTKTPNQPVRRHLLICTHPHQRSAQGRRCWACLVHEVTKVSRAVEKVRCLSYLVIEQRTFVRMKTGGSEESHIWLMAHGSLSGRHGVVHILRNIADIAAVSSHHGHQVTFHRTPNSD